MLPSDKPTTIFFCISDDIGGEFFFDHITLLLSLTCSLTLSPSLPYQAREEVVKSIEGGRPPGKPASSKALSAADKWRLQSLIEVLAAPSWSAIGRDQMEAVPGMRRTL